MGMKMVVSYSTVNRVVEFEENRRIAWKTGPAGFMGHLVAGRVWRYELTPVDGGDRWSGRAGTSPPTISGSC